MCRNPSCKNFGIHYQGPAPGTRNRVSDKRYTFDPKDGRFECKYCAQSFALRSNWSIAPFARYFLKASLPFNDCPNPGCSNHGYNVFEHFTAKGLLRNRRYRRDGKYRVICRECNTKFYLGEALQLTGTNEEKLSRSLKKSVRHIIEGVKTRRAITDTIEFTAMGTATYYKRLFRVSSRLRDYHAWRNARLLHTGFALPDEPIRVYTDSLEVSLNRWGEAARYRIFDIVATVAAVGNTYFILAAHPAFLPKEYGPTRFAMIQDIRRPRIRTRWESVHHTLELEHDGNVQEIMQGLQGSGRKGFYGATPYVELAHFLVVRKMLSRFRHVHYCMDGAKALYSAALTALAPDIQAERAEIVLFQHDKNVNPCLTHCVPK